MGKNPSSKPKQSSDGKHLRLFVPSDLHKKLKVGAAEAEEPIGEYAISVLYQGVGAIDETKP